MIKLKHKLAEFCPTCGSDVVVCERIQEYFNGQRWESREFLCGFVSEHCPIFSRSVVKEVCKSDPDYIQKEKELAECDRKIQELLEKKRKINKKLSI